MKILVSLSNDTHEWFWTRADALAWASQNNCQLIQHATTPANNYIAVPLTR